MNNKLSKIKSQLINIEDVIKNKNPRLLKILPKFIINFIKKIIHQKEINSALKKNSHLKGINFVNNALKYLGVKYKVIGEENIPKTGNFIFVSNHPLGGLDGLIFISAISKYFKKMRFPVNDLLLNVKNFGNLFLPINKHGKQSRQAVIDINNAYNSDSQILYFPAGLCSRKIKGKITDLKWQKNFIRQAIKNERDIIPVHIDGKNSNFFYRLANIRKFFRIKANIEMFFLPNEMFKQKSKKNILHIGKPISFKIFDKTKSIDEWAQYIRDKTYSLAKE
ncbi:MAG: 1-acyl-sn-glycerol-3-phosphate acyltransferase [Bacteroidales bacterium]|nr:1-acyl-sn-glycerol-3-phosphate acyltransferase [Bacteroidales bacterium]